MKSLAELKAIRERMQNQMNLRQGDAGKTRVVVGMATCGIAAGARPVMAELLRQVNERGLADQVTVTQTGCIGLCRYEPIVEVFTPDQEKITYVNMTAEKAAQVAETHLAGGQVVEAYTIGAAEEG